MAAVETKVKDLPTAAQFSQLQQAINSLTEQNRENFKDMGERLFGSQPTSLQSQITDISDRAFGDSPVSLKSRVTELETDNAVSTARAKWYVGIAGFFFGGLSFKAREVATFFAHLMGYR